jgi:hypothetical protein
MTHTDEKPVERCRPIRSVSSLMEIGVRAVSARAAGVGAETSGDGLEGGVGGSNNVD